MRWQIKPPKEKHLIMVIPTSPKPLLGDIKYKTKFAYFTKRIGDTKILWENYIEVYQYKTLLPYYDKQIGDMSCGPYKYPPLSDKHYELAKWQLKEVKLIIKP